MGGQGMSKNEYELLMLVEGLKAKVKELEVENARLRESSSSQDYNGSMVNPFNKD